MKDCWTSIKVVDVTRGGAWAHEAAGRAHGKAMPENLRMAHDGAGCPKTSDN